MCEYKITEQTHSGRKVEWYAADDVDPASKVATDFDDYEYGRLDEESGEVVDTDSYITVTWDSEPAVYAKSDPDLPTLVAWADRVLSCNAAMVWIDELPDGGLDCPMVSPRMSY